MTRLIDADALIEWIQILPNSTYKDTILNAIDDMPTVELTDSEVTDKEDFPEGFFEKPRRQATEEKGFDEKTCVPVTIELHGWICPKCGRTLSPYTAVCPCSDKWEVTC